MLVLEPLGRGSGAGQGQPMLVPGLGLQSDLWLAACAGLGCSAATQPGCHCAGLSPLVGTTVCAEASHHLYRACVCLVEAMFQAKAGHGLYQAWGHLIGVTMQVETSCRLCQAWSHLARGTENARLESACLGFVDLRGILGKSIA